MSVADMHEARATVSILPKGTAFTRYAMALSAGRGFLSEAVYYSENHDWRAPPEVPRVLRSAMTAGTTTDPAWATTLVEYRNMSRESAELLRDRTVIGRLKGARTVPANIRFISQTGGGLVGWLGQGAPMPIGEWCLRNKRLALPSVAASSVSRGNSLKCPRRRRKRWSATTCSRRWKASSINSSSIPPYTVIDSTGDTATEIAADLVSLFRTISAATLRNPHLVMTPASAIALAGKRDTAGGSAFPNITVNGGTVLGVPVIVSNNVPGSVQ